MSWQVFDFASAGTTVIDGANIITGSILGTSIKADEITGSHIKAGAITTSLLAAPGDGANQLKIATALLTIAHGSDTTKIDGGKLYTGSVVADAIAAGSINTDKLAVGTVSRDNLIVNGHFGAPDALGTHANGWTLGSGVTINGKSTYNNGSGNLDVIQLLGSGNVVYGQQFVTVTPGRTYTVVGLMRMSPTADNGTGAMWLRTLNASGTTRLSSAGTGVSAGSVIPPSYLGSGATVNANASDYSTVRYAWKLFAYKFTAGASDTQVLLQFGVDAYTGGGSVNLCPAFFQLYDDNLAEATASMDMVNQLQNVAFGGDVQGNYSNLIIRALAGRTLSAAAPGDTNVLSWSQSNGMWMPVSISALTTSGVWGNIGGTLTNQTDLNTALGAKASLTGAVFTGSVDAKSFKPTGDVWVAGGGRLYYDSTGVNGIVLAGRSGTTFDLVLASAAGNQSFAIPHGSDQPTLNCGVNVVGTINIHSSGYPAGYVTQLVSQSTAKAVLSLGNNGGNEIRAGHTNSGGWLDFYVNNTVDAHSATDGILALRINNTGTVEGYNNFIITRTGGAMLQLRGGGAVSGFVANSDSAKGVNLWNYENTAIYFGTNNTLAMTIGSTQNVGFAKGISAETGVFSNYVVAPYLNVSNGSQITTYWGNYATTIYTANPQGRTYEFGMLNSAQTQWIYRVPNGGMSWEVVAPTTFGSTITTRTPTIAAAITGTTSGVIEIPNAYFGSTAGFATALHMTTSYNQGYMQHISIGGYRTASGWGWNGGLFIGLGGSDANPTENFLLNFGGGFYHSSGTIYTQTLSGTHLRAETSTNDVSIMAKTSTAGAWLIADSANAGYSASKYRIAGAGKWSAGMTNANTNYCIAMSDDGSTNRFFWVDTGGNTAVGNQLTIYGNINFAPQNATGGSYLYLGPSAWAGSAPASTSVLNTSGIIALYGTGSTLFTFASSVGQMSVQMDGSLFVGDSLSYNPIGATGASTGCIVAQGSIAAGGSIYAGSHYASDADGYGYGLWGSNSYKIYMSSSGNGTYGGGWDKTNADYNMYFQMTGNCRGMVFKGGGQGAFAQLEPFPAAYWGGRLILKDINNGKGYALYFDNGMLKVIEVA